MVSSVCSTWTTEKSGKTNGIVIDAKMRAGQRRKLLRQEAGWRKTVYASVSIISMMSAETFADKKYLLTTKICLLNLLTKRRSADDKFADKKKKIRMNYAG